VGKTKRGKGTKLMAVEDYTGLPISVYVASTASPHHEVTLAQETVTKKCFVSNEYPARLIGDRAYDSDPLDYRLAVDHGIELIAPHRSNRRAPYTQDGLVLRRYKHRWKIERLFAWLQSFRRIQIRYDDYHVDNYLGFVQLGCMMILPRRCL
jgi:transposase